MQSQEIMNNLSKKAIDKNNNPFQIRLSNNKNLDFEHFLTNMETSLKEIILIENGEIDNIPLFTYPSEHSSNYDISDFVL